MRPSISILKTYLVLSLFYSYAYAADALPVDPMAGQAGVHAVGEGQIDTASCGGGAFHGGIPKEISQLMVNLSSEASGKNCSVELSTFRQALQGYAEAQPKCAESHSTAKTNCLEKCSPIVQQMVGTANMFMFSMKAMSIVDACSKMADTMNLVQNGLTVFSANCGVRQGICASSCSKATGAITQMKASSKSVGVMCTGENPAIVATVFSPSMIQAHLQRESPNLTGP